MKYRKIIIGLITLMVIGIGIGITTAITFDTKQEAVDYLAIRKAENITIDKDKVVITYYRDYECTLNYETEKVESCGTCYVALYNVSDKIELPGCFHGSENLTIEEIDSAVEADAIAMINAELDNRRRHDINFVKHKMAETT